MNFFCVKSELDITYLDNHASTQGEVEWLVAIQGAIKLAAVLVQGTGVVHGELIATLGAHGAFVRSELGVVSA